MPSIELRPFSNLDGLDAAFAGCVKTSIAGAITTDQRIELSTSQLAEPGLLLVELSKDVRDAVARAGYSEQDVYLQVTARSRTYRRRSSMQKQTAISELPRSPIELQIPGDPNGIEVFAELALSQKVALADPTGAGLKHTRLAQCEINLVHQREPSSFPRKQLTPEVCQRLKLPAKTAYFIEFTQEVLGPGFETSVVIWIEKDLGVQLDQKEDQPTSQLLSTAVAIDTAIAVGAAAWREAAKGSDVDPAESFLPDLMCTRWLAQRWEKAFGVRKAHNTDAITAYAHDFSQMCAEEPERMRAYLQHVWGSLTTSKRALQEVQS